MKLCRFEFDNLTNRLGLVDGPDVLDVSDALSVLPALSYPQSSQDQLIANLPAIQARVTQLAATARRLPLTQVRLLAPVANPGKIIAAPVNYVAHLKEVLKDPGIHFNSQVKHIEQAGLFLKANSSLVGAAHGITLTQAERRTDHEVELVIVIGKTCKNIKAADALHCVAGYSIGLDITIRGPEERSLRKSPDGYTVLGPWLTTADEFDDGIDVGQLDVQLQVNGETRQHSNTRELILGVGALLEFATRFYTLHPGDLIFTGTPEGVGPIQAGDVLLARIEGLGEMQVQVAAH